jgi:molybdate transport system substrate-binding protein
VITHQHIKFIILYFIFLFFYIFINLVSTTHAGEIQAAVATNFINSFKLLVKQFEKNTGHKVLVISGSTGKLYAQIVNGAPFDIFLSADSLRPKLLINKGHAVSGTQYSYALGKITLWSPSANIIFNSVESTLLNKKFSYIAIANPATAPYGKAAVQTLKSLGLWDQLKPFIVQGENIGQAFQFIFSKNAELGFVALSQVLDPRINQKGKRVHIPNRHYDPIKQDIVVLTKGKNSPGTMELWEFLKSKQAKKIIKQSGYGLQ